LPGFLAGFISVFGVNHFRGGLPAPVLGYALLAGLAAGLAAKLCGLTWSHLRLKGWFERLENCTY
jgi:hypothetical protein